MLRISCNLVKNSQKFLRHFSTVNMFVERQIKLLDNHSNSFNINYLRLGNGKNAVVLIPGALGTAITDFQPQINELPKLLPNHTIISFDPPGYGKSRPPNRTFPLDFYYRDAFVANELMKALAFDNYSVLGWSDGGIVGLILASKFTQFVDKLAVWGTNSYILPEETKMYENVRDVSKWSSKMREPMEKVYGAEYFAQLWSEWIDGVLRIFNERNGNICKDDLSSIKAKTLILHGAKDPMIASEHIPFLRKSIKHSQYYEFPNGKHNIHLRYANEFNNIVAEFLQDKLNKT